MQLIDRLRAGETPYVEPGLAELLADARPAITFTTDAGNAEVTDTSIVLVPTPSDAFSPEFSSAFVELACRDLASALNARVRPRYHLIVISSTLLPGATAGKIVPLLEEMLQQRAGHDFGVAYVPDFVALGEVVRGFQNPPFLLIGSDDPRASAQAVALYRRIAAPDTPIRTLSLRDAEIAKVAHNVFMCLKVSFANFLAQLGDRMGGADLDGITETLALEPKIGAGYLRAGGAFGGPCLPRDTMALNHLAQSLGLNASLARAADEINAAQYDLIDAMCSRRGHVASPCSAFPSNRDPR
ncbi:MAG TPA: hypothetical protein VHK26_00170 [Methyloceanibacter sp.]|nr:hypothetical protein [Methyloceanibacter sp.]